MSASLHWKPVPKEPDDNYLSHELMFKLRERLWDQGLPLTTEVLISVEAIPYLEGLADCGIEDAQKLSDLLREHQAVILYHET